MQTNPTISRTGIIHLSCPVCGNMPKYFEVSSGLFFGVYNVLALGFVVFSVGLNVVT